VDSLGYVKSGSGTGWGIIRPFRSRNIARQPGIDSWPLVFSSVFRRGLLVIVSPCDAPKTPVKRLRSALLASSALVCLLGSGQLWAFNLDDVAVKAKELAGQKFEAPRSNLPAEFRDMKFADYQKIRFREDKAEWAADKTPFKLSFYHQGMHFDTPVKINEVTSTTVQEIKYDSGRFDFGDVKFDPRPVSDQQG
jgi:glucans biosynthesis protein